MQLKPLFVAVIVFVFVTMVLPAVLVMSFGGDGEEEAGESLVASESAGMEDAVEVAVYRAAKKEREEVPLEEYLVGVVASEMDAKFELEALKAQALAARTYIVKQMLNEEKVGVPEGSDVTDTENHQVYKNDDELRQQWGKEYEWRIKKIRRAVNETRGEIITYEGVPINATFFSTSNGRTENAGEVWANELPYLVSVESPWDTASPKFRGQKTFPAAEVERRLGVKIPAGKTVGQVLERTAGDRVGKIKIGGKVFTGREIREKLDLYSTDFTMERRGSEIVVHTQGYGHGVGMSQYGANGMAAEGKTYEEIVKHYYRGVEISSADEFLNKILAER